MIASDDSNPNFVGAHNPDDRLHVTFYKKQLQNEFESKAQGRPIFYEADFVKIHLPGNQLNDIDTFVNETHRRRFPRQWAYYMNNQRAESEQIIGTPIAEWPLISRTQAEELRALGFRTVDSIASASDSQLQSIGMKAGMQPYAFREKAQRWLESAKNNATSEKDAEEKQALKEQNEAALKAIEELKAQMAELQANQRVKPGPKPKLLEGDA